MRLAAGFDVAADFRHKLCEANQLFGKTPNLSYLFCNLALLQGEVFTLLHRQVTSFGSTLHSSLGRAKMQQTAGE